MGLDDYAQALGQAQRLVPNWRQNDFVEAQLAQERLQPQIAQSQIAENQAQARAIDFKQQRQAAFQARLQQLGAKPSPQAYRALGAEFPEFHEAIDGVATGLDGDQAKSTVRRLAPIQALITNKQYDSAAAEVKRHLDADKAAGLPEDEDDRHLYDELTSGDAARQQAAGGIVYGLLASLDPKNAAENLAKVNGDPNANHFSTAGDGVIYDQRTGQVVREATIKPEWIYDSTNERFIRKPGTEGGDPASVGGAAGRGSDVSRLINSDAGGGQVPASVQTLGQFVSWGRALNKRGAKSSSAGTYQINGTTIAEFAPKALGPDWQSAPFTADAQDKVGKAIFDWAKQQPNPAAALKGRWVSLSGSQAAQLLQGDWSQARGTIAAGETGGGPGASASAPRGAGGSSGVIDVPSGNKGGSQFRLLTADEKRAQGLDVGSQFQIDPKGKITPLGRKTELTEGERKATGLLASMVAASNSLNQVRGYTPSAVALALNDLSNKNPIKANLSQTDRRVLNAQLAFSNAILRLESGAAIGRDETANKAQTLFPMPGDGPEVQADKRAQREAALLSMRQSAGAGADGIARTKPGPAAVQPPRGGRLIGTYQGKQVFQLPNGRRVVAN